MILICADCIHNKVCGLECVWGANLIGCEYKKTELPYNTGHWVRWYEQKETEWCIENIPHCKCSECGKEYDPYTSQFIKYCNECGARMVDPQESEE